MTRAHEKAYKEGNPGGLNASSLGSAAALQASVLVSIMSTVFLTTFHTGPPTIHVWGKECQQLEWQVFD